MSSGEVKFVVATDAAREAPNSSEREATTSAVVGDAAEEGSAEGAVPTGESLTESFTKDGESFTRAAETSFEKKLSRRRSSSIRRGVVTDATEAVASKYVSEVVVDHEGNTKLRRRGDRRGESRDQTDAAGGAAARDVAPDSKGRKSLIVPTSEASGRSSRVSMADDDLDDPSTYEELSPELRELVMRAMPVLRALPRKSQQQILHELKKNARTYFSKQLVLPIGDDLDTFYVVISGRFGTYSRAVENGAYPLAEYERGAAIGARALVKSIASPFSIKCLASGELFELRGSKYRQILDRSIEAAGADDDVVGFLAGLPSCSAEAADALEALAASMEARLPGPDTHTHGPHHPPCPSSFLAPPAAPMHPAP